MLRVYMKEDLELEKHLMSVDDMPDRFKTAYPLWQRSFDRKTVEIINIKTKENKMQKLLHNIKPTGKKPRRIKK